MARRRDPTDDLSDEMIQAYFEALASNPLRGGPAQTLGPEAPPPRNRAEQLVATPSPFVDPGERMLTPGGPPPARPPSLTPSAQPPRSTVFSEAEMTPAVTNALLATPGQRQEMQSEFEGLRNLAVTGAVAAPVGRAVEVAGRGAAAVGRVAGNVLARVPRTTAAATAGGVTALGTAETQEQPPANELNTVNTTLQRLRTRQTELETEDTNLRTRAERIDNLLKTADPQTVNEDVRKLQRELRMGRDDGRLGGNTRAAIERELQRIETERARVGRDRDTAGRDIERQETRARALERQGNRDRAEADRTIFDRVMNSPYGQLGAFAAGTVFGTPLSLWARGRVVEPVNVARRAAATEANALLSSPSSDISGRVAGVNEFFRRGGGAEPFRQSSRARLGFTPASDRIPRATDLFPQSGRFNDLLGIRDVGAPILYGGSSAISETMLAKAEQELAEVRRRGGDNPTRQDMEAERRLEDRINWLRLTARMSEGGLISYPLAMSVRPYETHRPDVARAGKEVGDLMRARRDRRRR